MADLIMLDERLAGRVAPVKSADDPNIASEERLMLGTEQLTWFKNELSESDAQWKIIGNQVIFSYLNWGFPTFQLNLDSWDGYPYERTEIINHIRNEQVENVVFVTGDTHSSWALEVTEDAFSDYKTNGAVAVEFGTTSINSGNTNDRAGTTDETVMEHEQNITGSPLNPQLKYANLRDHGYLELILSNDQAEAIWHYTPDKRVASREMVVGKKLITKSGSNKIEEQQ
jgi:alkaline phosphatase D